MSSKVVILVGERISDRMLLLSKLWKQSGYTTCLIYCNENPMFSHMSSADMVIKAATPYEIAAIATRVDGGIIHYFNYAPDTLGASLIELGLSYIYDYKDLFWNTITVGFVDAEKGRVEVEIVKHSKAITRRDGQIFYFMSRNNIEYAEDRIFFVPECFDTDEIYEQTLIKRLALSPSEDKPVRVVLSGGYLPESDPNQVLFEGIYHIVKHMSNRGIQVDLIGGFSCTSTLDLAHRSPILAGNNVNILPAMESSDYDRALLNYDFAMHMFNHDYFTPTYTSQFANSNLLDFALSSRIFPFVKACLPILLGKSLPLAWRHLEGTGFPVFLTKDEFQNINDMLSGLKMNGYRNMLYKHRKKYDFQSVLSKFSTYIGVLSMI